MTTTARIAAFLAVLAAVFGGAWAVGDRTAPVAAEPEPHADTHSGSQAGDEPGHDEGHDEATTEAHVPGGLQVAERGYRLVLDEPVLQPGTRPVTFTVVGPDGEPVTSYDVEHEKRLHLIAVRRDLSGFQHVHPELDPDSGRWSVPVGLTPGQWRVFADFAPAGDEPLTLGADLLVPGDVPAPQPVTETRTASVEGYTVTVSGDLRPGELSTLALEVSHDGVPVDDLQPYLGAYGHLVALRDGDLAYLHVHPMGEPGDGRTEPGPRIEFGVEVPNSGRYHLFLDFQHDGVVRTAPLVLDADGGGHGHGGESR